MQKRARKIQPYSRNARPRNMRLNTQPPGGATYYDPWNLSCSPCQSGSVNHCQTVVPPAPTENDFDWILEAQRQQRGGGVVPMSAPISECCETTINPITGAEITTCDVEQGCGWSAGPYLSDETSCRFTTEGATYPTHEACLSENPGAGSVGPAGTHVDWFPPCSGDEISNCYYPNVDACLPAVFGRPQAPKGVMAAAAHAGKYVCDGAGVINSAGRMSFPSSACRLMR
jgi:hypothetical protein